MKPAAWWWRTWQAWAPVALDAVSVVKSRKLRPVLRRISILFANLAQAASIAEEDALPDAPQAARALHQLGARTGVVTASVGGIGVWNGDDVRSFPALPAVPRDVTGAGDALIAGTLCGLRQPLLLPTAAHLTAELLHRRHASA